MAISIELSKDIKKKLDRLAKETERTRSQIIRLAIKRFIIKSGDENANRITN